MTVREWIRKKEITASPFFSVSEVQCAFSTTSEQLIKNELYNLKEQKKITSVYKGFYVITPVQYAAKGIIPPSYYIDQLMRYINKPYYISLLNAAELLGVSHQSPQTFSVTTIPPKTKISNNKIGAVTWNYRTDIPSSFLNTKNSETGIIHYSNAELTAIDLVQYSQYIGGLSRAATVLSELVEITNFKNKIKEIYEYTTLATLQRLGYILEEVLKEEEQSDILYSELTSLGKKLIYKPLSIQLKNNSKVRNKKWKININTEIEIDDI